MNLTSALCVLWFCCVELGSKNEPPEKKMLIDRYSASLLHTSFPRDLSHIYIYIYCTHTGIRFSCVGPGFRWLCGVVTPSKGRRPSRKNDESCNTRYIIHGLWLPDTVVHLTEISDDGRATSVARSASARYLVQPRAFQPMREALKLRTVCTTRKKRPKSCTKRTLHLHHRRDVGRNVLWGGLECRRCGRVMCVCLDASSFVEATVAAVLPAPTLRPTKTLHNKRHPKRTLHWITRGVGEMSSWRCLEYRRCGRVIVYV